MKKIAPAALVALKDALAAVYWYKRDFRTFVTHTVGSHRVLSQLNWDDTKQNTAALLVQSLARGDGEDQTILLRLMMCVSRMEDFEHLERLDEGAEKAKRARAAVATLAKLIQPYENKVAEEKKAEEKRKAAEALTLRLQGEREKIGQLREEFLKVVSPAKPHERGYRFERILRELFILFDLDPKASFKIVGEQIDGAFTFDNTDYLLEAKWQKELVGIEDLDAFSGKVIRKLENTLGLFVSINGFSPTAIEAHCRGRLVVILMDGSDLMAVLEGRIKLDELLLRKRRHAARTGNIFLPISEIMKGI